ncbi:MAG TPA: oxidoreductase [Bacteroidetes bacterium]|nr:oxidoreductase [Bacteroidota bacterium]
MKFNPDNKNDVDLLVDTIDAQIEDASIEMFEDGHRDHLGASLIGDSCSRKLWYLFRWVKPAKFDSATRTQGQVLRLFNRGHREEPAIIKLLEKSGHRFLPVPEGQDQHRITLKCNGHFGGSLDAVGYLPEIFNFDDQVLYEFKTAGETQFRRLKKAGVKADKPLHWAQMCVYGKDKGIHHGLYLCVNKNTDEIYIEFLVLDWNLAETMEMKAEAIIEADEAPAKIAMSASHFVCKWCNFKDVCHYDEPVDVNCRSCKHSKAVENSQWKCKLADQVIPKDVVKLGCELHEGI